MEYSIAFNANDHARRALCVQDSAGAVRPATPKEILVAAREVVLQAACRDSLYPRRRSFATSCNCD